jgi:hypothetical protein
MRIKRLLCGLALTGLAIGVCGQQLWALTPALPPRAPYTLVVTVPASQLGDCGPLGTMPIATGVDSTGPFFSFDCDVAGPGGTRTTYTYRPRLCGSCSVGYFGDGGIAAVADCRSMFERLERSTNGAAPGGPPLALAEQFGGVSQCAGLGLAPITLTPRDVMRSPTNPGTLGAQLLMLINPATNTFQDYLFFYSVWN